MSHLWLTTKPRHNSEIKAGIGLREASGATRHAADLAAWLRALLAAYPDRVLGFDTQAALYARELAQTARAAGVEPGFADLTLACIAQANGLAGSLFVGSIAP